MSFFSKPFSSSFLGVDIGTNSIKIVEVEKGKQLPRIANYGTLENEGALVRSNAALQTSGLKMFDDQVVQYLGMVLKKMSPKSTDVVASLPGFSAFMTTLTFPQMGAADVEKTMRYQAQQYVPIPIAETALEWYKVGEFTDEKGTRLDQILLISVPQEQIKKYQHIFSSVGLTLRVLEMESLSLTRSLVGTDPTPTLIIDIGTFSTTIVVVQGGQMKFASQSDFAGSSLTRALASSLNVSPLRAEELKRQKGIAAESANYELSTIMLPVLDVIITEAKRAQAHYASQLPGAPKIERVILSGGTANLIGAEKYFTSQFGVPAVKASPFLAFEYDDALEPFIKELNPLMSVALGVGLRSLT